MVALMALMEWRAGHDIRTEKETEPGSAPGPGCELWKPQSLTQLPPHFLQQGHASMSFGGSFSIRPSQEASRGEGGMGMLPGFCTC